MAGRGGERGDQCIPGEEDKNSKPWKLGIAGERKPLEEREVTSEKEGKTKGIQETGQKTIKNRQLREVMS